MRKLRYQNLSPSIFPQQHPAPSSTPPPQPQPFSNFNLLLTTWCGIASSSPHPPLPRTASPKPPDLRLGLIWTLCHPVSSTTPTASFIPPSLPLYQRGFGLKSFIVSPTLPSQCLSACCQLQLFLLHLSISQS